MKKYKHVNLKKQNWNNDCSLAAISMALRIPYMKVLKAAKRCGFKPDNKVGCCLHELFLELGYAFKVRGYFSGRWCSTTNKFYYNTCRRRSLPLTQPFIASIPSLNVRKGYHAVVVCNGVVYDSSRKKNASFEYFMKNRRGMYYDFRKVK